MLPGPIGLLAALLLLPATVSAEPFDFQTLVAEAKDLAGAPYQPPRTYDDALATWDFAQWDAIRHDPAQWLWPGSRFRIALSPPGYLFNQDVEIVELTRPAVIHARPPTSGLPILTRHWPKPPRQPVARASPACACSTR
jgi:glucan biosynthesis protein